MVMLISYDLNGHERPASYTKVKNYIEKHSNSSIRPLYSQWFVDTSYSPGSWVDAFRNNNLVDAGDRLFICEIRRPYQGLLIDEHWKWLNARL